MTEIQFTDQGFELDVLKSSVPVLVDFWAPWCGPCRVQGPIIEDLAKETDETKAKIGKINVDENHEIASKYGVMSIPTLAIFKDGAIVEQFVGVQSKEVLKLALTKHGA